MIEQYFLTEESKEVKSSKTHFLGHIVLSPTMAILEAIRIGARTSYEQTHGSIPVDSLSHRLINNTGDVADAFLISQIAYLTLEKFFPRLKTPFRMLFTILPGAAASVVNETLFKFNHRDLWDVPAGVGAAIAAYYIGQALHIPEKPKPSVEADRSLAIAE